MYYGVCQVGYILSHGLEFGIANDLCHFWMLLIISRKTLTIDSIASLSILNVGVTDCICFCLECGWITVGTL